MKKPFCLLILIPFVLSPIIARADSLILSPSDFQAFDDAAIFESGSLYLYMKSGSGCDYFLAPLHLPDRARLTSIVVFYEDEDSADVGNIAVFLTKINAYTNAQTVMAYWVSADTSGGFASHKISPIQGGNTINNRGYAYYFAVNFTSRSSDDKVKLYRIKVNYQ